MSRDICKQADTIAGVIPTIQGVGNSRVLVENFVAIHRIHFIHACTSAIEMQGGHGSFDFSRFALVFNLEYNAASKGNPSLAFHVTNTSFLDTRDINLGDGHKFISRNQKSEFDKARQLAFQSNTANFDNIANVCYETEGVMIWGGLPTSTTAPNNLSYGNLLNDHGGWLIALQNLVKSGGVLRETNLNPPTVEFGKYIMERGKWRFKKYTRQQLQQQTDQGVVEAAIVLETLNIQ